MSVYEGDSRLAKMFEALESMQTQYVSLKGRLSAAEGDRDKAIKAWVASSDSDEAVQLRDVIEQAKSRLTQLAEANVVSETLSDDEKAGLSVELKALADDVKTKRLALVKIGEAFGDDESIKAALEVLGDPTKSGRGRKPGSGGGTGSGLPRVSHSLSLVGGNFGEDDPWFFDTFSQAAMKLDGIEVVDLQKAFADAAGVAHEDIKSVKHSVVFEVATASGTVYTVTTEPKENKKPGRKPKAVEASVEASE